MLRNFGAFDVIHDETIQKDVEKLLKRDGFNADNEKWDRRIRTKGFSIRKGVQTKIYRSPRADIEICRSLFSFLRSRLVYHEEVSDGSPHAISLESVLQQRRISSKRRAVPLKQQMELALLWKTMSIILGCHGTSAVEFFRCFLPQVQTLPPFSLSTYWSTIEGLTTPTANVVDVAETSSSCHEPTSTEMDIPILPVAELAYLSTLHSDDMTKPNGSQASVLEIHHTMQEHDPLGVVQKMFDAAQCLSASLGEIVEARDKAALLEFEMAVAVKSARASLLLSCASALASSESLMNSSHVGISVLDDISAYVLRGRDDERSEPASSPGKKTNMEAHDEGSELLPSVDTSTRLDGTRMDTHSVLRDRILRAFGANPGGLILSFGKADHGKLGHGDSQVNRAIPTVVESMQGCNVVKVASMSTYAVVVDADGAVYVWGTGGSSGGMQGLRTDILPQPLEALSEKSPVRDVACGLGHALFLMANGRVCSWGNGGNGRLGLGDTTDRAEACIINDLAGDVIQSVHCGASHSMAVVKRTGRVYTWGKNTQGQCGRGNVEDILRPMVNTTLKNEVIVKMAAGWEHSIALTSSGSVYAWGSGYKDSRRGLVPPVLGIGHSEGRTLPEQLSSIEGIRMIDIASGWDHCIALDAQHRVYTWGSGQNGKLGHGNEENITAPCLVPSLEHITVVAISAGCEHSAVISADGMLFTWGHGDGGRLGHGDNEAKSTPTPVESLRYMHARYELFRTAMSRLLHTTDSQTPMLRPIVVSCGDKFTMIVVEPCADAAEFQSSLNRGTPGPSAVKVSVEHKSLVGACLSMTHIHHVVDSTILSPPRPLLQHASNSLTDLDCIEEGANVSPGPHRYMSQTISFGDKRLDYGFSTEAETDTDGPEYSIMASSLSYDGITGRKVLLSLLSLMCRSFDSKAYEALCGRSMDENGKESTPPKPHLAAPYSVEIITQTFQSLNSILASQTDCLFEKSPVDACGSPVADLLHSGSDLLLGVDKYVEEVRHVSGSLDRGTLGPSSGPVVPFTGDMTTWGILRCALNCLQQNLFALNAVSLAETSQATFRLQSTREEAASAATTFDVAECVDLTCNAFQAAHLTAGDRLVGILNGSIEARGLRSSDDEDEDDNDDDEEEDDEEDEDDANDDDDDDDSDEEDEEEDEEDYDQCRDDMLDDMEGGQDLYNHFEGGQNPYEEDEDSRNDPLGLRSEGDDQSGFGMMSIGDISRGLRSGGGDQERNNDSRAASSGTRRDGTGSGRVEELIAECAGLGISSAMSEEGGERSPALSHESLDCAATGTSDEMFDANGGDDENDDGREQCEDDVNHVELKGNHSREQDMLGEVDQEECDEDLQKAIFSSIVSKDQNDALQSILDTKHTAESCQVIPKLSGQLEYIARRCYDAILALKGTRKGDAAAVVALWLDVQSTIGLGFRSMYTIDEQRELLTCLLCKSDEWLHIFPGAVMGLQRGNTFGYLAGCVFVDNAKAREGDDLLEKTLSITNDKGSLVDTDCVSTVLVQLRQHHVTVKDVITDLLLTVDFEPTGVVTVSADDHKSLCRDTSLLPEDGYRFALLHSSVSLLQMSLAYFLIQRSGAGSPDKPAQKIWGRHMSNLFTSVVDSIDIELRDIVQCLPALSVTCGSPSQFDQLKILLGKILRNSVSSVMLRCIGGIATSSNAQVENTLFFLPHARKLLNTYREHCSYMANELHGVCNPLLVEFIQEWLLSEMRCVVLFVSSTVGLCNRATADASLGDEKFLLSKCYRSCVSRIIDAVAITVTDNHSVWRRLGSHVKVWSQLVDGNSEMAVSVPQNSDVLPEWQRVLDVICSDTRKGWDVSSFNGDTRWFADMVITITPRLVFGHNGIADVATGCDLLNVDLATFGLVMLPECDESTELCNSKMAIALSAANDTITRWESKHGIAFVSSWREWSCRIKFETYALVMAISGEHRRLGDYINGLSESPGPILRAILLQYWMINTLLLSVVMERLQEMSNSTTAERMLMYMRQVESQYKSLLKSSLNEANPMNRIRTLFGSSRTNMKSSMTWLKASLKLRVSRGFALTEDINLGLAKSCPDDPTQDVSITEYLWAVSDIGTLLFGDLQISRLEEIAVVTHICRRSLDFAADLCSEGLNLLSCSPSAVLYFIDGLQIDSADGEPLSSLYTADRDKSQIVELNQYSLIAAGGQFLHPSRTNHPDVKSSILALDETVTSLIKAVGLNHVHDAQHRCMAGGHKVEDSLAIIPSLIEALKVCIGAAQKGCGVNLFDGNRRLKTPIAGFQVMMDFLFAVCRDTESPTRNSNFWNTLSSLNVLMTTTKSIIFCGDKVDTVSSQLQADKISNLDVLHLCNDLLCVLSSVVHGLCDIKVNLLRSCSETKTKILLPKIRNVNYSSPVVISNSSTENGNYNLGFWIKIPRGYCDVLSQDAIQFSGSRENPVSGSSKTPSIKTHILSRVPEAGEVDMTSLFKDLPSTPCNPGVVLETTEDGKSVVVVKVTTCVQTSGTRVGKPIRVVKLSSRPLENDVWLDISIQFTCLPVTWPTAPNCDKSGAKQLKKSDLERSVIQLFVNGELHVSAEDCFGRLALHQNIIFGTTPVSLIKPVNAPCLLAGSLRWSMQSSFDSSIPPSAGDNLSAVDSRLQHGLDNSYSQDACNITLNQHTSLHRQQLHRAVHVKVPFEPIVCLQKILFDVTTTSENCMVVITKALRTSVLDAFDDLRSVLSLPTPDVASTEHLTKKTEYLCSILEVFPSIAQWSVSFVGIGDGHHALHDVSFEVMRSCISVLGWCRRLHVSYREQFLTSYPFQQINRCIESTCLALRSNIKYLLAIVGTTIGCPIEVLQADLDGEDTWQHWLTRARAHREVYDSQFVLTYTHAGMRLNSEGTPLRQNENAIVTGIAAICSQAVNAALLDVATLLHYRSATAEMATHLQMVGLFCAGGWPASLRGCSVVDLHPRALFLHRDAKSLEHSVFPASAVVQSVFSSASGRPGVVWIHQCTGAYLRCSLASDECTTTAAEDDAGLAYSVATASVVIPRSMHTMLPTTEMVSSRDTQPPLSLSHMSSLLVVNELGSGKELVDILISLSTKGSNAAPGAGKEFYGDSSGEAAEGSSGALSLTVFMARVRSLLVQIATVEALESDELMTHMGLLRDVCERDIKNLLSIASLDPVTSVIDAFQTAVKSGSGNSQLDVLSNLLREGDVSFLEKITLRVWRHFHDGPPSGRQPRPPTTAGNTLGPTALAGDVQIVGNRIRALSHFPSVQVLPVHLERMTGRWFYECILLSDGLMQIGWADRSFRCDPVCGQGVGDHLHSWAVDGLRTKKWNVSCDTYGARWKTEDVVGVIVDMDLLEMKFFLNGLDLGSAFVSFATNGLYPAISLNVRQCLRVNYGQEKFMFPPNEVDGLPFRPVIEALKTRVDDARPKQTEAVNATSPVKESFSAQIMDTRESPNGQTGDRSGQVLRTPLQMSNVASTSSSAGAFVTDSSAPSASSLGGTNGAASSTTGAGSRRSSQGAAASVAIDRGVTVDEEDDGEGPRSSRRGMADNDQAGELNWRVGSRGRQRRGSRDVNGLPVSAADAAAVEANDDGTSNMQSHVDFFSRQQPSGTSPELEARRQLLIENLIGMGFPVDWALRSAEHCDASVSESNAIAWIIERMELEQAKLEELEGGDSRIADEEDYDDMEDVGMDNHNRGFGYGASHEDGKDDGDEDALGRPRPTPLGGTGMRLPTQPAPPGYGRSGSKSNAGGANAGETSNKDGGSNSMQDQGTWNNEAPMYSTLLVGHQSARRRFDLDKQAVLLQISELDFCDLFPIVLSCQFSLCIFYARAAFIRLLRVVSRFGGHSSGIESVTERSIHSLVEEFRNIFLTSCDDLCFAEIVNLLGVCFKQGLGASSQPEKLFPSLLQGTLSGDPIDLSPPLSPFTSLCSLAFTNVLANLEMDVFGFYGRVQPVGTVLKSLTSIAIEESALQSAGVTLDFVRQITATAFSYHSSPMVVMCGDLIDSIVNECIDTFELATQGKYDRRDWISFGSERLSPDAEYPHSRVVEMSSAPKVLWAYSTLCVIVQEIKQHVTISLTGEEASQSPLCLENILPSEKVSRMLKAASQSPNTSLSFCVYGVCSEILSCVNRKIIVLEKLLLSASTDTEGAMGTGGSSASDPKPFLELAALGQKELKQSSQYYSVVSLTGSASHARTEGVVSAEYRALRSFSYRLVTESSQYRVNSKYARTMSSFLLEVLTLRRAFTGIASMSSNVHFDIVEDWIVPSDNLPRPLIYTGESSTSTVHATNEGNDRSTTPATAVADGDNEEGTPPACISLTVNQISANSITISWSGIPQDEDWSSTGSKVSSSTGSARIAASVGGIIATIKGASALPAGYTSYSLYVTPVSGAVQGNGPDERNKSMLVSPFVSSSGSQKIDFLHPDTLYRVSLSSDDSRRKSPVPGYLVHDESKPLFGWSSSILRHSKSTVDTKSDTQKDAHKTTTPPGDDGVLAEKTIMVSTLGEALFLLDSSAATCPSQLQVDNHGLTVRNTVSKKWSTIRSTVRLSSGTHKWEVMIDRCISKNIFIGVVGPEARPDNYVGCDKHGWAFLANRAIWNNKGKLKSYGELFRTGDMVTVTLDLDEGTLAFAINGKDLGVAVEGLSGPLYPAFSLYNQFDQISLSPPRQPHLEADVMSGGKWGTSSAERVVQRMEMLQIMLRCCAHGRSVSMLLNRKVSKSGARRLVGALHSPFLVTELAKRWALWKNDIGLRTVRSEGDIVSILVSSSLCLVISENRYCPGDVLHWENGHYTVLGVGRHRLWMQKNGNGEVVGFSRDTIHQLNSKNALRIVRKSGLFKASLKLLTSDLKSLNLIDESSVNTVQEEETSDTTSCIREADLEDSALMRRALISECEQWGQEDDKALVEWLDLRARVVGCHPLNLKFHDVVSPAAVVEKLTSFEGWDENPAIASFCARFGGMAKRHSNLSIRLRALFLLHFNDILSALLPLVFDVTDMSTTTDDVSLSFGTLLHAHRDLILTEVKFGFGFRLAWSTAIGCNPAVTGASKADIAKPTDPVAGKITFSTAPSEPPILPQRNSCRDTALSSYLRPLVSMPVAAVTDKDSTSQRAYGGLSTVQFEDPTACIHSSMHPVTVASVDVCLHEPSGLVASTMKFARGKGQENTYGDDYRWRLLAGYQCSVLGQLVQSLESNDQHQAALDPPTSSAGNDDTRRPGDGTCDAVLRSVFRGGLFWEECLPPKARPVCLNIQSKAQAVTASSALSRSSSRLMRLLAQCCSLTAHRDVDAEAVELDGPSDLSQWSLLQAFVTEALVEIQPLFASALFTVHNSSSPGGRAPNECCSDDIRNRETEGVDNEDFLSTLLGGDLLPDSEAGVLNLLLHIMHATGIVLGIALRSGVSAPLNMSEYFWSVLCNEPASSGRAARHLGSHRARFRADAREACARAVRNGVSSTVPEALLDLFHQEELRVLLCRGGVLNTEVLRSKATAVPPLEHNDTTLEIFWAAISDLPRSSVMKLLQAVWATDVELPDELFHWKDSVSLLAILRVALLEQPDCGGEFSIVIDERTLYIPSTNNFSTMQLNLRSFVDSL